MDDREYQLKQAELGLKEREVSAKEREVAAKEKEGRTSKWFNPVTIAIYVAAIGLFGNIITNILSNDASANAERVRSQSDLVLSVIKTNGDEEDTCKNLKFFVKIGWLDDPQGAIHNACGDKGKNGVPTLPASSGSTGSETIFGPSQSVGFAVTLSVGVEDADSHEPIANAKVDLEKPQQVPVSLGGSVAQSVVTNTNGLATLNFVTSYDNVTVSKDGYEVEKQQLSQVNLSSLSNLQYLKIELHHTPKSKH